MKIGALIPVRLASERLPGKALMDICGRPMIYHLLDRVLDSRFIGDPRDVVVCTTKEASDDRLEHAINAYGCSVYRGDTDDIIRRFGDAMDSFNFDSVVQADGDDPLSSTEYMDLTMDKLLAEPELDIVTSEGLPFGCNVKSFTRKAMNKVLRAYRSEKNDTGFVEFFTKTGLCAHAVIEPINDEHIHDTVRLTLDYDVDLALFRAIFEELYQAERIFTLAQAIAFLHQRPELVALNSNLEEEYWERHKAKSVLHFEAPDGQTRQI